MDANFGHERPIWDFSEHDNYVPYHIIHKDTTQPEKFVYVKNIIDTNRRELHGRILCFLDVFTRHVQHYIKTSGLYKKNKCLDLFMKTKHTFYELYRNIAFKGVNKPIEVHHCRHAKDNIGKDHKLRAHSRNVMIVVQENVNDMYDLYCHEIAHTLCNHVQFRPDDHHGDTEVDFPHNEKLFQSLVDELNFREQLSQIYTTNSTATTST
jgi:hypothetical protein